MKMPRFYFVESMKYVVWEGTSIVHPLPLSIHLNTTPFRTFKCNTGEIHKFFNFNNSAQLIILQHIITCDGWFNESFEQIIPKYRKKSQKTINQYLVPKNDDFQHR